MCSDDSDHVDFPCRVTGNVYIVRPLRISLFLPFSIKICLEHFITIDNCEHRALIGNVIVSKK